MNTGVASLYGYADRGMGTDDSLEGCWGVLALLTFLVSLLVCISVLLSKKAQKKDKPVE